MSDYAIFANSGEATDLRSRYNGVLLDEDVVSDLHRYEFDLSVVLLVAWFENDSFQQCYVLPKRNLGKISSYNKLFLQDSLAANLNMVGTLDETAFANEVARTSFEVCFLGVVYLILEFRAKNWHNRCGSAGNGRLNSLRWRTHFEESNLYYKRYRQ